MLFLLCSTRYLVALVGIVLTSQQSELTSFHIGRYTMVLADNVDGGDDLDLIVTTMNGNVFCFSTQSPHHPLKVHNVYPCLHFFCWYFNSSQISLLGQSVSACAWFIRNGKHGKKNASDSNLAAGMEIIKPRKE